MLKGNDDGMMSIRHERAEAAGLKYRPLDATVRDTQAWWATVPEARRKAPKFTISPALEAEALADLARCARAEPRETQPPSRSIRLTSSGSRQKSKTSRSACMWPTSVVPVRGIMPTSSANRKMIWLTVRP